MLKIQEDPNPFAHFRKTLNELMKAVVPTCLIREQQLSTSVFRLATHKVTIISRSVYIENKSQLN